MILTMSTFKNVSKTYCTVNFYRHRFCSPKLHQNIIQSDYNMLASVLGHLPQKIFITAPTLLEYKLSEYFQRRIIHKCHDPYDFQSRVFIIHSKQKKFTIRLKNVSTTYIGRIYTPHERIQDVRQNYRKSLLISKGRTPP